MNIKNLILALAIVAIVVVAGGLGFYYWSKNGANTNTTNTTTNTNEQVHVSLPPEAGDIQVNKSVTYKDVAIQVTTASKTTEYQTLKAESGKQFVVLFLAPTTTSSPEDILTWAQKDVRLVVGTTEIAPDTIQIVGAGSTEKSVGHLAFKVKDTEKNFTLQFGSGDAKKTLALGF